MTHPRQWLDIRDQEWRPFLWAFAGAFLCLSFIVLTRSLREAFFLSRFPIQRLPWMMAAVVVAGFPAVSLFSRLLRRRRPAWIMMGTCLVLAVGLAALWNWLPRAPGAILLFYLWTAVGGLMLTSGLWTAIAELFPLRGAKRLFSLIAAGGTAGAMFTGISISWVVARFQMNLLVILGILVLLALVFVFYRLSRMAPAGEKTHADSSPGANLRTSLRTVWRNNHLRTIAALIFATTLLMTLVDFQFKDLARGAYSQSEELAAFFGAFYGWAGLASLLLQLLLAGRMIERAGIALTLAADPLMMILASTGLLLIPGLPVAILARGADYTLRKSLLRPAIELLYVPVPLSLRRMTKVFIDSLVDNVAEGLGAGFILLWLSVLGWPSGMLAIPTFVVAVAILGIIRRIDRSYFHAISSRLREEGIRTMERGESASPRDLLGATFTSLNLDHLRESLPDSAPPDPVEVSPGDDTEHLFQKLSSSEDATVLVALGNLDTRKPEHLQIILRVIARDELYRRVVGLLQQFPSDSAVPLIELLQSPDTDFVIRRRIPEILAHIEGSEVDDALVALLKDSRFEVRYRAAVALVGRRRKGLLVTPRDWRGEVWLALSMEVRKDRPLWELQKLLDDFDSEGDDMIQVRVGVRGELSLEHTFRLLSLVLDPEEVRAAYLGVILDDLDLKSYALEYLEHVLPSSIRRRLWLFIGDVSDRRKERMMRPVGEVVDDMMATGVTMFGGDFTRMALRKMIVEKNSSADSPEEQGDS